MRISFVEALDFTAVVYRYFATDAEYVKFQDALVANPERGDPIAGCAGLRKTRWRDSRRGKGKRGGLRVLYLWVPEANRVLLLDVYDKDESDDLSIEEKRALASLVDIYRQEARATTRRRT